MSARFTLDQISKMTPAIQAQVMADQEKASRALPLAFIGEKHPTPPPLNKTPTMPIKPAKNRIRQNSAGLNKTEQAFLDYASFSLMRYRSRIYSQDITLKLANGCRYTPDILIRHHDGSWEGFEVKGYAREDSIVKLKVAASIHPWIKFHLVTRKKGEWQIQEVLP